MAVLREKDGDYACENDGDYAKSVASMRKEWRACEKTAILMPKRWRCAQERKMLERGSVGGYTRGQARGVARSRYFIQTVVEWVKKTASIH